MYMSNRDPHKNQVSFLPCTIFLHLLKNFLYLVRAHIASWYFLLRYHGVCLPSMASSLSTNRGTPQFTDESQLS